MKRYLILFMWNMQIKATNRYHYTPFRMAKIRKTGNNKCWEGYVQLELSYIAHGSVNCYSALENCLEIFIKAKYILCPSNPKSNEYICSLKDVEECSQ